MRTELKRKHFSCLINIFVIGGWWLYIFNSSQTTKIDKQKLKEDIFRSGAHKKKPPLNWYSYGWRGFWHNFGKVVLSTSSSKARTKLQLPFARSGRMVVKSFISSEVTLKNFVCILVIISFVLLAIFIVYQLHNLSLSTFI